MSLAPLKPPRLPWQQGYLGVLRLEGNLWLALAALIGGRARLVVCDETGCFDGW